MTTLIVCYNAYAEFKIPEGVKLMSVEDNDDAPVNSIGSWWIKWNTLHYYDADGKEQKIDGSEPDVDAKRPIEGSAEFDETIVKGDTECFYCRDEAFGTYGEKNLPMCRSHKHSTGNSDTDDEED